MSIPLNQFFTITPSTNFKSKGHAILTGQELFFYIADNGDLRVQNFGGIISYTLDINCHWCCAISQTNSPSNNLVHVYYTTAANNINYIAYQVFGSTPPPVATGLGSAVTFDVFYATQATTATIPPHTGVYMLILDDGQSHQLTAATDPAMHNIVSSTRVFTNITDTQHYVSRPTLAMHPEDTNIVTVNCQQFTFQGAINKVGFYTVKVPGLA